MSSEQTEHDQTDQIGVSDVELGEVLDWAGEVRANWQAVLDLVACGRLHFADAIQRVPIDRVLGEMKLIKLLEARPGARKVDTRRRLEELGFRADIRLRELGNDGRVAIIEGFGGSSRSEVQ